MRGEGEQGGGVRAFDDLTRIHHRDAMRDAGDDAEIMGDQQDRETKLVLQLGEQTQDLRLHA